MLRIRLSKPALLTLLLLGCADTPLSENRSASESSECRGLGNYHAGKEGGYRPCCEGLNEQPQQLRATNEQGAEVCADLPLRVYACVEGTCGDGRCEDPEAVACGCPADCPIARLPAP
jgi:hypothetical protein